MRLPRCAARPPALPGLVLILVLLGAGSKAGLVPLHVWLPLAHPAAPSHVSALMSGVMTKVAVYGFIRIVFDLNGPPAWWWSIVVIPLAGITCVLGVLSALMQHDLKRLLAYHTVENIGIIFIGLGLALAFSAHDMPAPAALALTAALFHVFNHSIFKSLLFFGSGAVLTATGERDMEHLGGLIHRMPLTAFAFLVGCVAISALPPLNGFVSEWLTFQAILLSPDVPSWGIKLIVPAVGAMLALVGGARRGLLRQGLRRDLPRPAADAGGGAGAGDRPRVARRHVRSCRPVPRSPESFPGFVIDGLAPVVQSLVGGRMPVQSAIPWLSIVPIAESRSSYNGLLVFAFIAIADARRGARSSTASPRAPAPRPGLGLRLSRPQPGHAIHRRQLRPADPPRLRRSRVPRARAGRHAAARRPAAGAADRHAARPRLGRDLCARSAAPSGSPPSKLSYLQFLTIRQFLSLVFARSSASCSFSCW